MKYDATVGGYSKYLEYKLKCLFDVAEDLSQSDLKALNILDFGCHDGKSVMRLREQGYNISGFDIVEPAKQTNLWENEHVRYSDLSNYRIPWPDKTFEFVYSHHVFEHVSNYSMVLAELRRVLAPEGFMLHVFPSKRRVIEAHWYVPFGGVFQNKQWYRFSREVLRLAKPGKEHLPTDEYIRLAQNFVKHQTNYLSYGQLMSVFQQHFSCVRSVSTEYLAKLSPGMPATLVRVAPDPIMILLEKLVSEFHVRVLWIEP